MTAPLDRQNGLVRYFFSIELLPDLLALAKEARGGQTPRSWSGILKGSDSVTGLLGATDLPVGQDHACIVADDAWRLANWLELLDADGLTFEGIKIASGARVPLNERLAKGAELWALEEGLRTQIRKCYLGDRGLSLVDLVEQGANAIEDAEDAWIKCCPGLFLVEFEALLFSGSSDVSKAERLVSELVRNRQDAMRSQPQSATGIDDIENQLRHMLGVSKHYSENLPQYVARHVLSPRALRSTARLFVGCGLLNENTYPISVEYLTVTGA